MKKISILVLAVMILSASVCFAHSDYIAYSMPVYGQGTHYNWCWNAASKMVESSQYNVTKSQEDVARIMNKGESKASLKETASAMKIYTDFNKSTGYMTTSLFSTIASKLQSSRNPLVMGITFTYSGAGHAVAVYK